MKSILLFAASGMSVLGPFVSKDAAAGFIADTLEPTLDKADPNGDTDVSWAIIPYVNISGDDSEGAVSDVLSTTFVHTNTEVEQPDTSEETSGGVAI